jgi:hypothetical protein
MNDGPRNRSAIVPPIKTVKRNEGRLELQSRGSLDVGNPVGGYRKISPAKLIRPYIQRKGNAPHRSLGLKK